MAESMEEWIEVAQELDRLTGKAEWRERPESGLYEWKGLMKHVASLRVARSHGDINQLMFLLRLCSSRNFCGISNPLLYYEANAGTKRLIEEFTREVCLALCTICYGAHDDVGSAESRTLNAPFRDTQSANDVAFVPLAATRPLSGKAVVRENQNASHARYTSAAESTLTQQIVCECVQEGRHCKIALKCPVTVREVAVQTEISFPSDEGQKSHANTSCFIADENSIGSLGHSQNETPFFSTAAESSSGDGISSDRREMKKWNSLDGSKTLINRQLDVYWERGGGEAQRLVAERDFPSELQAASKASINEQLGSVAVISESDLQNSSSPMHCKNDMPKKEDVLRFLITLRLSLGRTALCLSGGGSLAMYHMGVIKTLLCMGCLPRVISGTSGGSILAGVVAIYRDDELLEGVFKPDIVSRYGVRWFPPVAQQVKRFFLKGQMMDALEFQRTCQAYYGDYTFKDAFAKTGRLVSIVVTPASRALGGEALILNHINTPDVFIWSAVTASCSLPGLLPPHELMVRSVNGRPVAYCPSGLKWMDGSITQDIPIKELSSLFNVKQFIVSQVNPHHAPFVEKHSSGSLRWMQSLENWLTLDIKNRYAKLAKFNMIPRIFGQNISSFWMMQVYEGHVTITPQASLIDWYRMINQPSLEDMEDYIIKGSQRTWPHCSRIAQMVMIEQTLRKCWTDLNRSLRQKLSAKGQTSSSRTEMLSNPRCVSSSTKSPGAMSPPLVKQHYKNDPNDKIVKQFYIRKRRRAHSTPRKVSTKFK